MKVTNIILFLGILFSVLAVLYLLECNTAGTLMIVACTIPSLYLAVKYGLIDIMPKKRTRVELRTKEETAQLLEEYERFLVYYENSSIPFSGLCRALHAFLLDNNVIFLPEDLLMRINKRLALESLQRYIWEPYDKVPRVLWLDEIIAELKQDILNNK